MAGKTFPAFPAHWYSCLFFTNMYGFWIKSSLIRQNYKIRSHMLPSLRNNWRLTVEYIVSLAIFIHTHTLMLTGAYLYKHTHPMTLTETLLKNIFLCYLVLFALIFLKYFGSISIADSLTRCWYSHCPSHSIFFHFTLFPNCSLLLRLQ